MMQLLNQGIIDKLQSQINKNNRLYFPSDEEQNIFSLFAKDDHRLMLKDEALYPSTTAIEEGLKSITIEEKASRRRPLEKFKIIDPKTQREMRLLQRNWLKGIFQTLKPAFLNKKIKFFTVPFSVTLFSYL
jgi:hypothetical protein